MAKKKLIIKKTTKELIRRFDPKTGIVRARTFPVRETRQDVAKKLKKKRKEIGSKATRKLILKARRM